MVFVDESLMFRTDSYFLQTLSKVIYGQSTQKGLRVEQTLFAADS